MAALSPTRTTTSLDNGSRVLRSRTSSSPSSATASLGQSILQTPDAQLVSSRKRKGTQKQSHWDTSTSDGDTTAASATAAAFATLGIQSSSSSSSTSVSAAAIPALDNGDASDSSSHEASQHIKKQRTQWRRDNRRWTIREKNRLIKDLRERIRLLESENTKQATNAALQAMISHLTAENQQLRQRISELENSQTKT